MNACVIPPCLNLLSLIKIQLDNSKKKEKKRKKEKCQFYLRKNLCLNCEPGHMTRRDGVKRELLTCTLMWVSAMRSIFI